MATKNAVARQPYNWWNFLFKLSSRQIKMHRQPNAVERQDKKNLSWRWRFPKTGSDPYPVRLNCLETGNAFYVRTVKVSIKKYSGFQALPSLRGFFNSRKSCSPISGVNPITDILSEESLNLSFLIAPYFNVDHNS